MNKALRVILNILIIIAALVLLVCLADLAFSFKYANREVEDPAETYRGVFEYELKNRAYGEVLSDYYVRRLDNFTPETGYEDLYHVAEYAHAAFMVEVCDEKGDSEKASLYREKAAALRGELSDYKYTADEVDEMLKKRAKHTAKNNDLIKQ